MAAPQLTAQIQGQTLISGDRANTYVQWCSTAAQLRDFIGLSNMTVYMQGITAPGDGGQGAFSWDSTVTQPDDNTNYIVPLGASGGGWVRIGPPLILPIPAIIGALSSVTDPNAQAVISSIISALTTLGLVTNGTT